jgi:hypothetical protein
VALVAVVALVAHSRNPNRVHISSGFIVLGFAFIGWALIYWIKRGKRTAFSLRKDIMYNNYPIDRWLGLVLLGSVTLFSGCLHGIKMKRDQEMRCPTDIRQKVPWCVGEDAIFHCPSNPDSEFYGVKPTCWGEWPASGADWRNAYCGPPAKPYAMPVDEIITGVTPEPLPVEPEPAEVDGEFYNPFSASKDALPAPDSSREQSDREQPDKEQSDKEQSDTIPGTPPVEGPAQPGPARPLELPTQSPDSSGTRLSPPAEWQNSSTSAESSSSSHQLSILPTVMDHSSSHGQFAGRSSMDEKDKSQEQQVTHITIPPAPVVTLQAKRALAESLARAGMPEASPPVEISLE